MEAAVAHSPLARFGARLAAVVFLVLSALLLPLHFVLETAQNEARVPALLAKDRLNWAEGSPSRVVLQRITSSGLIAGGWPANGFRIGTAGQNQTISATAPDGIGGAFLAWQGRTGSGPVSWWATRVCPNGSLAPGWPLDGAEVCPNIRYTGGGSPPLVDDGAGGVFAAWYRRTATTGWGGTIHSQRLGSTPPSAMSVPVMSGSPSSASIANVTVTFDAVTTGGQLQLDLTVGPPPPEGLRTVPAAAPAVYELNTTAVFTGSIDVCIDYNPADVGGEESALRLLHFEGSGVPAWVDITTSVDVGANRICGQTTSLSPFAIVENEPTDARLPAPALQLHQNRPNPFNPTTTIAYEVPEPGWVKLSVYDVRGRLVRTLANRHEAAGTHEVLWSGDDQNSRPVGSGVYFYKLETPQRSLERRMVLVR